ncbi:hypothetical protein, partial [Mesorhizobium sp. M7A.F.Ca.CA.001.08.2.1]|uniref:hypothetical protein n=1 Tax=Mesorhizobium sp. M7A.F.Ca.CA.001.08.2.1 TaxID=2496692 RepID=UPI0019D1B039
EKIPCVFEPEPIGHDRHAFIEKLGHSSLRRGAGQVSTGDAATTVTPPAIADRQLPANLL